VNSRPPDPSNNRADEGIDPARVDALVQRAKAGDEDAFGELVMMHHARVYAVVYRMVSQADDAQELTQQTWIKAWKRLATYKQEAKFFTWLYRIAVNTAMDHLRQRKRRQEVELNDALTINPEAGSECRLATSATPDRDLEQDEIRKAFREALDALSPEHKAALILREVEGLSYKQIAEATKCRIGTVMSRIYYARRAIQDRLKEHR
jgi:RNA polymerase sigma-70 factor (ECF subfamily)